MRHETVYVGDSHLIEGAEGDKGSFWLLQKLVDLCAQLTLARNGGF